jgi:hypothetical protein
MANKNHMGTVWANQQAKEDRILDCIDKTRRPGDVNINGRYQNSGFDKVSVRLGKDGGFCYSFGCEERR